MQSVPNCSCKDPLLAEPRFEREGWMEAHQLNQLLMRNFSDNHRQPDVVFLGDSITEEWNGRHHGNKTIRLNQTHAVFQDYFQKRYGAQFEGLALGIAGDKTRNLLWRLQNGEMPQNLNPKVWWIHIGTNDFLLHKCNQDIVFIGIIRIVREIIIQKPNTIIVINGVLPTTLRKDGRLTTDSSHD